MVLFVSGMWMVNFEYLQFTLMLTDSIVTLPDAEDQKRSSRLNSTGFTASSFWSQSQTSHTDWEKLPKPVCPGDGGETFWGCFLKEAECWTIIPYPSIWQRSSDVQENMTADSGLPPASVYECLPHMPEHKKRKNTYSQKNKCL